MRRKSQTTLAIPWFTRKKLAAAGVPAGSIDDYLESIDLLPNLRLLAGTANIEKQNALPADWIGSEAVFPGEEKRKTYIQENDLDGLPLDLARFLNFFNGRKTRMRDRLVKALGVTAASSDR